MKEVVSYVSDVKFDKDTTVCTPCSVNSSSESDYYSLALTISYSPMCLHVKLFINPTVFVAFSA